MLATTFSLVAIFAPVGFMSGIVGRFMQSFGLTMAFAVLVSLFVSFTLTPMMSAYWLKAPPKGATIATPSTTGCSTRSIAPTPACSTGRWRIAAWWRSGAVLVLLSSVPLFRVTAVNFTPEDDQSQFDVTMRAPEGTSLAATEVLANRLGTRDSADPRGGVHAGHRRRRRGRHAEHGQHAGPAPSHRGPHRAISSR